MPLGGGVTVGKAAEKDAAVRDAMTQALDKAKVKTDYNHGKGVAVTLKLDLHDLWDAIKGAQ